MDLSFSVIDYIGKIEGGVAILLSMKVDDNLYELAYWFNKEGGCVLTADKYFLNKYNLVEMKDFKGYEQLIYLIDKGLPTREEIFKEFDI